MLVADAPIAQEMAQEIADRPRTRAECRNGNRPCGYVGCKFHMALEVNPRNGTIKIPHPDLDVTEIPETCVLDVAERGGASLDVVGQLMNISWSAVAQLERAAILKLRQALEVEWQPR